MSTNRWSNDDWIYLIRKGFKVVADPVRDCSQGRVGENHTLRAEQPGIVKISDNHRTLVITINPSRSILSDGQWEYHETTELRLDDIDDPTIRAAFEQEIAHQVDEYTRVQEILFRGVFESRQTRRVTA